MEARFINPFLSSTVNVLKTMAHSDPVAEKPRIKEGCKTWGVITGVIGMGGDSVSGNMLISFDEKSILAIVSKMLTEEFKQINHEVVDAVGEITNMICGGAKRELSEMGFSFSMATPIMLSGKEIEISQLSRSPVIQIPFSIPEGKFVIEANLASRQQK